MNKNSHIPKIRVIIRKRPLSKKEFSKGQKDIVQIANSNTVLVKQDKVKVDLTPYTDQYKFIFDGAFNENATNQEIYYSSVRPLIDSAYDGARVSCFAYGQTGSGKTYTMLGDGNNIKGLYLLATKDVFDLKKSFPDVSVWVSFYQIYCGKLYDLLNERNILHARQDAKNNINIVGLSERRTESLEQVMNTIEFGTGIRVTSQNSTNMDSSRSHAILQLTLKINKKIHGKISFIDLAGSQRAADHAYQTDKQTRIDGAQINKSLLALKQCIRALDQNKHHTPFRGSKLTMVLKDSFVGYCKTVMIGNISPNSYSCENTLNTLKYADRVKQLKKSTKNQLISDDYLNGLSKQLMLPRQMIQHHIHKHQPKHSQSQHTFVKNNNFFTQNQNSSSTQNIYGKKFRKNSQSINCHSSGQKQRTLNEHTILKNRRITVGALKHPSGQHKVSNYAYGGSSKRNFENQNSNIFSFDNSSSLTEQQIYNHLNERHQTMMQKVIKGEEDLMSIHEHFINFSVESAKQHITLMNQADKVGSSIQIYLNSLDNNLQKQLQQIYRLKGQMQNLKYNLDQAKKLQALYVQINKNHDEGQKMQMDNDENLLFQN